MSLNTQESGAQNPSQNAGAASATAVATEEVGIKISVKDMTGKEILFRIKGTTKMQKVIDAYCNKLGLNSRNYRFLHQGVRITGDQTADDLKLCQDDVIDVMAQQTGGGEDR